MAKKYLLYPPMILSIALGVLGAQVRAAESLLGGDAGSHGPSLYGEQTGLSRVLASTETFSAIDSNASLGVSARGDSPSLVEGPLATQDAYRFVITTDSDAVAPAASGSAEATPPPAAQAHVLMRAQAVLNEKNHLAGDESAYRFRAPASSEPVVAAIVSQQPLAVQPPSPVPPAETAPLAKPSIADSLSEGDLPFRFKF